MTNLTFIPQYDERSKSHQGGAAPHNNFALRSRCPASGLDDFSSLRSPTPTHRPWATFLTTTELDFTIPVMNEKPRRILVTNVGTYDRRPIVGEGLPSNINYR